MYFALLYIVLFDCSMCMSFLSHLFFTYVLFILNLCTCIDCSCVYAKLSVMNMFSLCLLCYPLCL